MSIVPIACAVQNYAWGSTTSIPALLSRENPDQSPWAEFWMGAHPRGCSKLPDGQSLADFIAEDPEARLGQAEGTLPFLFKILAAEAPLSIQCHPNRAQAEAGFAKENAAGVPLDAPHRNYRDRNHKPELIVALEDFWALKGFRDPGEIRQLFEQAGVGCVGGLLDELTGEGGLRAFFAGLLALEDDDKAMVLTQLAAGQARLPDAEADWTGELLRRYPGDIGATSALVLRLVKLRAGQGLYLGAGELHAYLRGTGLEIMANSDNVLRGGLTPKHIDPQELLQTLRFEHSALEVLDPLQEGKLSRYPTDCDEFALSCRELGSEEQEHRVDSATILLSLGGSAELRWSTGTLSLAQGEVAFCTADTGVVHMRGDARLWMASVA
jgi:mannose-6-phosphate isomerase